MILGVAALSKMYMFTYGMSDKIVNRATFKSMNTYTIGQK
jgi:hypothetical protein